MPTFKNLAEVEKYISNALDVALKEEVAEFVKQEYVDAIDEVVYQTYEPKVYERRESNRGLKDPNNIAVTFKKSGSDTIMTLSNRTKGQTDLRGKLISRFLEEVGIARGPRSTTAVTPLPYTQRAINELKTKRGSDAMKGEILNSLKRFGIKAKIK